jgi:hypothetical protein
MAGPPGWARTSYLLLRRQLLYPDELQADDLKNKPWYLRKVAGFIGCFGAGDMNRTRDLLITNELLYQLSYTGERPQL